jgi:hypothetical protein
MLEALVHGDHKILGVLAACPGDYEIFDAQLLDRAIQQPVRHCL